MTELRFTTRTVLSATAPFDLACSLRAMRHFTPCARDQEISDGRVRRAFLHPSDPSRAVVTEVVGRDDGLPGVAVTVFSDTPLTATELSAVGATVSTWLSLDDDRGEFLLKARADPWMARIVDVAEGLHQVRFASVAEAVVYFLLTHSSTQWFAAAWKRRVAKAYGPQVQLDGVTYNPFPAIATLIAVPPEKLAIQTGSIRRAVRIITALTGLAAFDEGWLRSASFAEARTALLSVKHIGPFTAQAVLLRALGHPDAVPLEMAQFVKVATQVYENAPTPSPAELRDWYGPHIGWWAYTARTAVGWIDTATPRQTVPAGLMAPISTLVTPMGLPSPAVASTGSLAARAALNTEPAGQTAVLGDRTEVPTSPADVIEATASPLGDTEASAGSVSSVQPTSDPLVPEPAIAQFLSTDSESNPPTEPATTVPQIPGTAPQNPGPRPGARAASSGSRLTTTGFRLRSLATGPALERAAALTPSSN